eukprot:4245036-Prorocentrum_lima.AAC.1
MHFLYKYTTRTTSRVRVLPAFLKSDSFKCWQEEPPVHGVEAHNNNWPAMSFATFMAHRRPFIEHVN